MKLNLLNDAFVNDKMAQMNWCNFSYISIGYQQSVSSDIYGCFINSAWMNHYSDERLYKCDPLLEASDKFKNQPIPWNSLSLCTKKKVSVMNMRFELTHVNAGITICTTMKNGVKRIFAVGDRSDESILLEKYQASLPLFNSFYSQLDPYMMENYI